MMRQGIYIMRTVFRLFFGLILIALPARADFSADLLAAYFFDNTAADSSGKGYDAQLVGATFTTDRYGHPAGALLLDGQGAYAATPVSGKRFPLSFSFWFRLDAKPGSRPFSILDSGIGDAFGHSFVIGSGAETFNANMAFSGRFARGRWSHVVVTFGDTLKVYMDGQLAGERAYTEDDPFVAGNFQIGRHFDSANARYYEGAIDDILIYARTLDEHEVRRLFEESRSVEQHVRLGAAAKSQLAAALPGNEPAAAPVGASADPKPILVVASSGAEPHTNAWHAVDGRSDTQWAGAPGETGWWLAAEFYPPLILRSLDLEFAPGSATNALAFYSETADEWPELAGAVEAGPVTARFLLLTFPADGTNAPALREIRWNPAAR